jgi:hypothetical protein
VRCTSIGNLIKGSENKLGIRQMEGMSGLSKKVDRMKIVRSSQFAAYSNIPDIENADYVILISPEGQKRAQRHDRLDYESSLRKFPEIICLVLTESVNLPSSVVDYSQSGNVLAFATLHDEYLIESRLKGLYNEKIMHSQMIHGTLINWHGVGVVLVGESGTGKSSCARRLVADHKASLVADDAIIIEKRYEKIYGRPHELTKGLVEVRGRGLMDAKTLFGKDSLADNSRVDLVVRFVDKINCCHESGCRFMDIELPVFEVGMHSDNFIIDKSIEDALNRYY